MKALKFILVGILFGIIMTKSEAASWFRIQEMFRFHSFHMYGIIGSTVFLGILIIAIIKKLKLRSIEGEQIRFVSKDKTVARYLVGGTIFGLGWALTGACPGPIYVLIGQGYFSVLLVLISAILGTFAYGILREKLPH